MLLSIWRALLARRGCPHVENTMTPHQAEASRIDLESYRGYRGLPPLVGLHSMNEAATRGLTVSECVARLLRLHWSLKRLHFNFVARITATPIYELKMAFSLHAFYCAEHVEDFATRVREMRQPPYGLEISPDASLDLFFDEILTAPSVEAFTLGMYSYAVPAVVRGLERLISRYEQALRPPHVSRVPSRASRDAGRAPVWRAGGELPRFRSCKGVVVGVDVSARQFAKRRRRSGRNPTEVRWPSEADVLGDTLQI